MIARSHFYRLAAVATVVSGLIGSGRPAFADPAGPPSLVPIGASYEADTLGLFAQQAVQHDSDSVVTLRVLPITYASDPYAISAKERADNLELLQRRAGQLADACEAVATDPCEVTIIDMQIQSDAYDPALVAQLDLATVDGVYIPGGDQTFAMIVIANSPAEDALEALAEDGVSIGGNSAGAAVQSRYMIAGYTGDNSAWDGLKEGAVDLWYDSLTTDHRGLRFGLTSAVMEQHVLQRGRLARLLQAAQQLPNSHVGVGLDNATAAVIDDGVTVHSVTGLTAAAVVDEDTYGSALGADFVDGLLSIHDVALHLLPPGPNGYDLSSLIPTLDGQELPAPSLTGRGLDFLTSPAGSGRLILAGDLWEDQSGPVVGRFASLAGAASGPTVVLGLARTNGAAQSLASNWKEPLRRAGIANVESASLATDTSSKALADLTKQLRKAGAIFVTSEEQDIVPALLSKLQAAGVVTRWQAGVPLLLDNGAAAAAGAWMSAEPTPSEDDKETLASNSFLIGDVAVAAGLNLFPATTSRPAVAFEPRALVDYLYGRLISQIYQHPGMVTFGIDRGTAIEVTPSGATVLGQNGVIVFDGRYATWADGINDAIGAAWLILDTFAPGEGIGG